MALQLTAADERRHAAGPDRWWGERWAFSLVADDGTLALHTSVTLYPRQRRTWFATAVLAPDHPYVLCRDDDIAMPSTSVIELRTEGLWMHAICETPLEHWTVAIEAFAVAFDDPSEAVGSERGERIGLAYDLEWESVGNVRPAESGIDGYTIRCVVNGDAQLGDRSSTISGTGSRSHHWGVLDADGWSLLATSHTGPTSARYPLRIDDEVLHVHLGHPGHAADGRSSPGWHEQYRRITR
jgi:hypothetical protein